MLAPFYHVGLIVPDLAQAKRDLTATLGLSWASEQRREMPVLIGGRSVQRDISFVYSTDGPPYVELIGANEPPWNATDGLHHIGMWSEDVVADMEALVAERYTVAATGLNRKGLAGGFAYLNSPTGLLVELVDTRGKASFDRWLAGGEYL
jgi:catechol 2,3-dioxygenase-like lactoylglutathione lyase family enzyme